MSLNFRGSNVTGRFTVKRFHAQMRPVPSLLYDKLKLMKELELIAEHAFW